MKRVYQSIVDAEIGDCLRAVIASLFDLDLHDVPPLVPDCDQYLNTVKFFREMGYPNASVCGPWWSDGKIDTENLIRAAKFDGGVGGYFYASVPSQTFEDSWHAVVVDSDLNVVHDPNPNQLAMNLGPAHVQQIMTVSGIIFKVDGTFEKATDK